MPDFIRATLVPDAMLTARARATVPGAHSFSLAGY